MGYFPFFVDLSGREGLVAGGGAVALRKIRKLLPYGPGLTVASVTVREEILQMEQVTVLREPFREDMLNGKYFVIAATDDRDMNHRISRLCRERNILVNVVDDQEACSFIFPSLVRRGKLSVGISTEGASPTGAVYVRKRLEKELPENFDQILAFLEAKRPGIKNAIGEERQRSALFSRLFELCLEKGRELTEEEFGEIMRKESGYRL